MANGIRFGYSLNYKLYGYRTWNENIIAQRKCQTFSHPARTNTVTVSATTTYASILTDKYDKLFVQSFSCPLFRYIVEYPVSMSWMERERSINICINNNLFSE